MKISVITSVIILIYILLIILYTLPAYAYTLENASIDVIYDVNTDIGLVIQKLTMMIEGNETIVKTPLITSTDHNIILNECRVDNVVVHCIVIDDEALLLLNQSIPSGRHIVTINYTIMNYVKEVSTGVFVGVFNLTGFSMVNSLDVKITFTGGFKVVYTTPSENVKIMHLGDSSIVSLSKPEEYTIVLSVFKLTQAEIPSSTSPTSPEHTPVSSEYIDYIPFIIIFLIIVTVFLLILYFRRRFSISVEALPANILDDDTSRAIIKAIGDAGDKGVKQSELVRLVNRPKSSISRRIKRLADEGYVEIVRSGKYNIIKLTDKGVKAYRDIVKGGKRG